MKFYSEILNKVFETEKDCVTAEKEYAAKVKAETEAREKAAAEKKAAIEAKAVARKNDAKKVEDAYKTLVEANKAYQKALEEFCGKHGVYHKSISNPDEEFDLFNWLFRF